MCFICGRYGHIQESCLSIANSYANQNNTKPNGANEVSSPTQNTENVAPNLEKEFGSWMLAKKFQHRKKQYKD